MIIDRLVLKNFKRFRSEEIRFKDGITGILGNNGTGKSSIVTAILFALYGVQATGIAPDYIVSSFASPKEKCEVRLDFRIGGDNYTVVRTFKKGKAVAHDATFHREGKLVATGVSPVDEAVKRTLGMGAVDFRNTIYAGQKDLLVLLENTPGKRKEWFLKALGIDYLKSESDAMLKDRADARTGQLQAMTGKLDALAGRVRPEDLAAFQETVASCGDRIRKHTEKAKKLKEQRSVLIQQQKACAEKRAAYAGLLKQQQAAQGELRGETVQKTKIEASLALIADEEAEYHRIEKTAQAYPEVRARLDSFGKTKAEYDRVTGEIGFAQREIADLAARIGKEQALIDGLEKDAEEMAGKLAAVRAGLGAGPEIRDDQLDGAVSFRLAEIQKRHGGLAARQAQYQEEREKLEKDQETIRAAGPEGTCPLCRQKLGAHFGSLDAEFSRKLSEITEKAVQDLEQQEKLEKERGKIEALKPALNAIRTLAVKLKMREQYGKDLSELKTAKESKEAHNRTLEEARARLGFDAAAYTAAQKEAAEVQKVQARYTELGKKIGHAVSLKQQLADLASRIRKRNDDIAALEQEIAAAAFDPAEAERIESALKETDAALSAENVAIATAEKDRTFAHEKIAEFRNTEEQIKDLQKQSKDLEDEIGLIRLTRTIIADYVIYLMQVVRSRLEGEVSRIISEITSGRYDQVLLDPDFNLLVRDVDADYAIDRFSGGEQDDIAVALRIALSRYLAELHNVHESTILIFDEIFGSQDEERRNNLLTTLRSQESRFPQILLISHIPEIQGEFSSTLVVEMNADGSSRVKEVA